MLEATLGLFPSRHWRGRSRAVRSSPAALLAFMSPVQKRAKPVAPWARKWDFPARSCLGLALLQPKGDGRRARLQGSPRPPAYAAPPRTPAALGGMSQAAVGLAVPRSFPRLCPSSSSGSPGFCHAAAVPRSLSRPRHQPVAELSRPTSPERCRRWERGQPCLQLLNSKKNKNKRKKKGGGGGVFPPGAAEHRWWRVSVQSRATLISSLFIHVPD